MRRSFLAAAGAVAALLTSVAVAPSAGAAPSSTGLEHRNVPVCDSAPAGLANCDAVRHDTVDHNGKVAIDITYQVKVTNDRRNLVYPFYVIPREGEE